MVSTLPLQFGIPGGPELLVILLIAVLLFGANKIPKLARSTGEAMGEFQKGREEVEQELQEMREGATGDMPEVSDNEPEIETDVDGDETESEPQTDTETETETETDSEPQTDTETETETDSEPQTDTDADDDIEIADAETEDETSG